MRRVAFSGLVSLVCFVIACDGAFDDKRATAERGSLGEEVYGVLCDRIGGQSLREDLTGESFYKMCHKVDGAYQTQVDAARLPKLDPEAKDEKGQRVPIEQQEASRARSIGAVESFAKQRGKLVAALDFAMPDIDIDAKDLGNEDGEASCGPSPAGFAAFYDELSAMLGRFTDLYNDGTIPYSTRSLATVTQAFAKETEAQKAYARMSTRKGYRPPELALGVVRPMGTYPQLRDLSNAMLGVISNDSKPYDPNPQRDGDGRRIPVPGAAYDQFSKLLEASNLELRNAKASAPTTALTLLPDGTAGRSVLSRPRTALEIAQTLALAQDNAFGGGMPRYIVKRDARGYAVVNLQNGSVPAPFVDMNGDKLPDVAPGGGFVTTDGKLAPTPFVDIETPQDFKRDSSGRPSLGTSLAYEYIDTSNTFMAGLMGDMKRLANPDAGDNEGTIMDLAAGLPIAMGTRESATRRYEDGGEITYSGVQAASAPVLDMVYALSQLMGERSFDESLVLVKQLFISKQAELARVIAAGMAARNAALADNNAKIPLASTLWDDILEPVGDIAADKSLYAGKTLLEDVVESMADDDVVGVGAAFSGFAQYRDKISYNRSNLNGPAFNQTLNRVGGPASPIDRTKPDSGDNRSIMQRFLQLLADTDGVSTCNKAGGVVHARLAGINLTVPLFGGSYKECEVYMIPDLGHFYMQSIVGEARFYIRDVKLREGQFAGLGAASTDLIEGSSGITGFWTSGRDMRPRPEWNNRFVHFDLDNDSKAPGAVNYRTNHFLTDLASIPGTNFCTERTIADPCKGNEASCFPNPADNNMWPDGRVRGLRDCAVPDRLNERHKDTLFTLENFNFYKSMAPIMRPFVNHKREDIFVRMATAFSNHWQTDKGTASECTQPRKGAPCFKDGASSYEALLTEMLSGDLFPALNSLVKAARAITVPRCTAVGANGVCTATTNVPGLQVLTEMTRAAADPSYAKQLNLKDRNGSVTAKRNDGKTYAQTTPLLMLANAFGDIDREHAKWIAANPGDTARKETFVRGRSALADAYFRTEGTGATASFGNKSVPKIVPIGVDVMRSQLWARCPKSFSPPYERCAWARDTLPKDAADALTGPLVATGIDLVDGVRRDPNARREMLRLMRYMTDTGSPNDAFTATLTSGLDVLQILRDEENLVPFLKVVASATSASVKDGNGRVVEKSLVDAQLALLGKISGKAFDQNSKQICKSELDPNQILPQVIAKMVTPMNTPGLEGKTPMEVLIDVVADVNRSEPSQEKPRLDETDYLSISNNVVDFLLSRERGMEQFYEIVRKGTIREKE
jgi:hypothetical protein